jgi:transposase
MPRLCSMFISLMAPSQQQNLTERTTELFSNVRPLGMLEVGIRQDHVARLLGCTQGTISNLVRRFRQSGSVDDRGRSGRPRVTTVRQDRYIVLQHLRNRFHPASRTASTTIGTHRRPVSATTIRRRLRESGLRNRRPFRGPILTDRIRNTCIPGG